MQTYLTLWKWTEQGAKSLKETVNRYQAFKEAAQQQGCTVVTFGWTQGPYDGFFVAEAPDEQTAMAMLLTLVGAGNVTTTTLRAFTDQEMQQILQKVVYASSADRCMPPLVLLHSLAHSSTPEPHQ